MAGIFRASSRTFFVSGITVVVCLALLLLSAGLARADQMVASWYGPGFEGATTASGEPFDPNDYTAAHRTLPFGTKLIVTYNDRSVVVRINDRGPYIAGRDIDLSQAAAQYIGLTAAGEAAVSVSTASPSTPTGPYAANAAPQQPVPEAPQAEAPQSAPTAPDAGAPGAGRGADEEQYAADNQYEVRAADDQYVEPAAAEPAAPAEAAPVAPPPTPDPSRVETPPAELAAAGSTVERRVVIFVGPTPEETPEPVAEEVPAEVKTAAASPEQDDAPETQKVAGLSVLPDTGGASLALLAGGVGLISIGAVLLYRMRRQS